MEIPHEELLAPVAVRDAVCDIVDGESVVALDGRAPDIEQISHRNLVRSLWISRLNLRGAKAIAALPALRRLVVHDWRVESLEALSGVGVLESLAIVGSPRLKALAGIEAARSLRELILFDNCNYTDLRPLSRLVSLRTLCLEGGFSKPLTVDTLGPLEKLSRLERLRLASIRARDKSLRPLHQLAHLRNVFVAATFPEKELRALAEALPDARGKFLDQHRPAV